MKKFQVTIRTSRGRITYPALAMSSIDAWSEAAALVGDTPCGITVTCQL